MKLNKHYKMIIAASIFIASCHIDRKNSNYYNKGNVRIVCVDNDFELGQLDTVYKNGIELCMIYCNTIQTAQSYDELNDGYDIRYIPCNDEICSLSKSRNYLINNSIYADECLVTVFPPTIVKKYVKIENCYF